MSKEGRLVHDYLFADVDASTHLFADVDVTKALKFPLKSCLAIGQR